LFILTGSTRRFTVICSASDESATLTLSVGNEATPTNVIPAIATTHLRLSLFYYYYSLKQRANDDNNHANLIIGGQVDVFVCECLQVEISWC
jgi:hypothetical protein